MNPVSTPHTNTTFILPGGTEENNLPIESLVDEDQNTVLISTWELTDEERQALVSGGRIQLLVWGGGHPPVALRIEEPDAEESNSNTEQEKINGKV